MTQNNTPPLAHQVITNAAGRGLMIATAESCTGGLIAGALTDVAGASDVIDRGFVTYSDKAKQDLLGVPAQILDNHGAVSEQTARAMADGAVKAANADLAIAVTGIAGPGGGSDEKPVGLVYLAVASANGETIVNRQEYGNIGRTNVRAATVQTALQMLQDRLQER